MAEQQGAHRRGRLIGAFAATVTAVAALSVAFGSGSALAATAGTCEARGIGVDGSQHLSIAQANPQFSPCVSDSVAAADARAVVVPGVLGINVVTVSAKALKSFTVAGPGTSYAQADIASLTIAAPGLLVSIDAVHADATSYYNTDGASIAYGSAWVTGLRINGVARTIGSTPTSIPLGLGLFLNLNQQSYVNGVLTVRAVSLTSDHPNNAQYHTEIGEAVAGP